MNAAQGLGLYLSLYRAVHGAGAGVPFPGSPGAWTYKHTDTSQDILAKMELYATFNIADGAVTTWSQKWPGLCAYFDLVGAAPATAADGGGGGYEPLDAFAKKNQAVWDAVVQKHGLKAGRLEAYGWAFLYFIMDQFDFDRQYDLS
jgi:hypothetical protein